MSQEILKQFAPEVNLDLPLQALAFIKGSHSSWWVHMELYHRFSDNLTRARHYTKRGCIIQLNCEEVHTSTNCEQSYQREALYAKKNVSPYIRSTLC